MKTVLAFTAATLWFVLPFAVSAAELTAPFADVLQAQSLAGAGLWAEPVIAEAMKQIADALSTPPRTMAEGTIWWSLHPWQEAISGVFTLIAGSFVLLSAWLPIWREQKKEKVQRRERLIGLHYAIFSDAVKYRENIASALNALSFLKRLADQDHPSATNGRLVADLLERLTLVVPNSFQPERSDYILLSSTVIEGIVLITKQSTAIRDAMSTTKAAIIDQHPIRSDEFDWIHSRTTALSEEITKLIGVLDLNMDTR